MWKLHRLNEFGQFTGESFTLLERVGTYTAGRQNDCTIRCPSTYVSRKHCVFSLRNGSILLKDLNTSNGTYVNRNEIMAGRFVELQNEDIIGLGVEYLNEDIEEGKAYVFKLMKITVTEDVVVLSDDDEDDDVISLPVVSLSQPVHSSGRESNLSSAATKVSLPVTVPQSVQPERQSNLNIARTNNCQPLSHICPSALQKQNERLSGSHENNHVPNSRKRGSSETEFSQPPVAQKLAKVRNSCTSLNSISSSNSGSESHSKFQNASPSMHTVVNDSNSECARSPFRKPFNIDHSVKNPKNSLHENQPKENIAHRISNSFHNSSFSENVQPSSSNKMPALNKKTSETVTSNTESFNILHNSSPSTVRNLSEKVENVQENDIYNFLNNMDSEEEDDDDAITVRNICKIVHDKTSDVNTKNSMSAKKKRSHSNVTEEYKTSHFIQTNTTHNSDSGSLKKHVSENESSNNATLPENVTPQKEIYCPTNPINEDDFHLLSSSVIGNDSTIQENETDNPPIDIKVEAIDSTYVCNSYSMDDKDDIIYVSDDEQFPSSQIFDDKDLPQEKLEPRIEEAFLENNFVTDEADIIHDSDSETESLWLFKLSQGDKETEPDVKDHGLQKDDVNDTQDDFHPKMKRKVKYVIEEDSEVENLQTPIVEKEIDSDYNDNNDYDYDLPLIGDNKRLSVDKSSSATSEKMDTNEQSKAVSADTVGYRASDIDDEEPSTSVQTKTKENANVSENKIKMQTRKTVTIDALPLPHRRASLRGISGINANKLYEETMSRANSMTENRKSLSKKDSEKFYQKTENRRLSESGMSSRKEYKKLEHIHPAKNRKLLSRRESEKSDKLHNANNSDSMSKSDMKLIRKEKLRALTSKKSEEKTQDDDSKRSKSSVKAKVTSKNRGAFLTENIPALTAAKESICPSEISVKVIPIDKQTIINNANISKSNVTRESLARSVNHLSNKDKGSTNKSKLKDTKELAKIPKLASGSVIQEISHKSVLESPVKRMTTRYSSSRRAASASSSRTAVTTASSRIAETATSSRTAETATSSRTAETATSSRTTETATSSRTTVTSSSESTVTDLSSRIAVTDSSPRASVTASSAKVTPSLKTLRSSLKIVKENKKESLQNKKPVRRVRFKSDNELVSILYIPPEGKGMKMPKPRMQDQANKGSQNSTSPVNLIAVQRDSLLRRIINWKHSWIEEEKRQSDPPPVFSGTLYPMMDSFESISHYLKTLQPLMLLELWANVSRDSDSNRNQTIYVCTDSGNIIDVPGGDYFTMICHTVLNNTNEKLFHSQLQKGTLVLLELSVNEKDGERKSLVNTFGYIMHSYKQDFQQNDLVNTDLMKHYPRATKKLVMSINLKTRPYRIDRGRVYRLKVISYIGAALRLFDGLFSLEKSPLCDYILHLRHPPLPERSSQQLVSKAVLNKSQAETILSVASSCLSDGPTVNLIHGPPGTGKTKVIVNLILQILDGLENKNRVTKQRHKILLCAPSNAAVDEIVARLMVLRNCLPKNKRFRLVRSGCVDNMNPIVKSVSVQEVAKKWKEECINNDDELQHIVLEKRALEAKINMLKASKTKAPNPELLNGKINEYEKRKAQLEDICDKKNGKDKELITLQKADIIATTLGSCYTTQMKNCFDSSNPSDPTFCCCIIDEATQCSEPDTLVPLMLGIKNLVLVGDPEQLRATVISQKAKKFGYGKSLFSRLQETYSNLNSPALHFLDTQYRMHPEIAKFPSKKYYADKLITPPEMASARNSQLKPYLVLSLECTQANDRTLRNVGEAEVIVLLTSVILNVIGKNAEKTIGIITPYQLQKKDILRHLEEKCGRKPDSVTVDTIDGFQGQERDIILMSCVRTNGIGFMSDHQRINVALTRARESLILCGNFSSLQNVEMWGSLLKDAASRQVLKQVPNTKAKDINYLQRLICRDAV